MVCISKNQMPDDHWKSFWRTLWLNDFLYTGIPRHVRIRRNGDIREGSSSLVLHCSAVCLPNCTYTFLKDDVLIQKGLGATKVFNDTRREDSGNYTCRAENRFGFKTSEIFQMQVHCKYNPFHISPRLCIVARMLRPTTALVNDISKLKVHHLYSMNSA